MRILTWNILWRERDDRRGVLTDHIRRIDPDVILLQESSPGHADALASDLGFAVAVVADDPVAEVVSTPSIITRLPFVAPIGYQLGRTPDRTYWLVEVTIGGIRVATMHLQHTHQAGTMALDSDYRAVDTRAGVEHIADEEIRNSVRTRLEQLDIVREVVCDGTPTVFGGDLNFAPDGIEYRTIVSWNVVDTWRVGPRLTNRATILQANPLVHGGTSVYSDQAEHLLPGTIGPLDYTLDYLFSSPGLTVGNAWTVGRPLAQSEWPSDHLGVVIDLTNLS